MGKTGDTKKQILEMLEIRNETLTGMSEKLGLAPSTVSQHVKELVDSGQIRQAGDRARKWKYYELNKGYPSSPSHPNFPATRIVIPIAGMILIAVLATGFYLSGSGGVASAQEVYIAPGSAAPQGSTVFTISDSPQFYNISAIFVTVLNASVRSTSGKWYSIPLQEKSFNLVQLKNISEILSGVNLTRGSYDELSLSVSNVTAIVNGTSKPVFLPSGKITVLGGFNISTNSTNWVNIDFDLGRSLHITGNGTIIMTPVIVINRRTCNDIELNSSSIVVAGTPAQEHEDFWFGMDMNGSMRYNFSEPQNMSFGIQRGRPMGMGFGNPMLFMRMGRGIIIGNDGRGFLKDNMLNATNGNWIQSPYEQVNGSWKSTANSPVVCPLGVGGCQGPIIGGRFNGTGGWNSSMGGNGPAGGWAVVRLPPGLLGGNASGYANCRFRDGGVDCDQNESTNMSGSTGRIVARGGSCIGLQRGGC
jgi:DNA-binding transcriptional ArsR family regulator